MPFTADGIRPDLIINPHAIPSRMTIGQLVESLFGKACAMYGAYGDCTAFSTKGANAETYGRMLTKIGYHSSGNQILYNGMTGEQIFSDIYIGPTYYMRLKHMVKDKINYRALGPRTALTRQTVQGRANDGGLRIGEMERDGILAHGASYFLTESYMVRGDQYYMAVCNKTGAIAVFNPSLNLFLSPFADGPLKFNTTIEGKLVLDVFSVYGRSFSLLKIPYSLKLLIQELQVMNIQMRIITEDNIDQLLNLSYQSKNIEKLLHIDLDTPEEQMKIFLQNYKKNIQDTIYKTNAEIQTKGRERTEINNELANTEIQNIEDLEKSSPVYMYPPQSPQYPPGSPSFSPPEHLKNQSLQYQPQSPQYPQGSPAYQPQSPPYSSVSPAYQPQSPQYAPGSPAYQPQSPQYPQGSPAYQPDSPVYQPESPVNVVKGPSSGANSSELDFENTNYLKKSSSESNILNVEEEPPEETKEGEGEDKSSSGETKKIIIT